MITSTNLLRMPVHRREESLHVSRKPPSSLRTGGAARNFLELRHGEVLGMVGLHLELFYESNSSCVRIMALVVGREHRGRGVGRTLISIAEDWARRRGAEAIMLTTHKRRGAAHRFYLSMGYEATGYRFYKPLEAS